MKTITAIFIFLIIAKSALGSEQFKGDTIRIRFDDFLLEIITSDLAKNSLEQASVSENAEQTLEWLGGADIAIPKADEMVHIFISDVDGNEKAGYKNVTFEIKKRTLKKVVISDGNILEKDFGNFLIEIRQPDYTIKYYLMELQDLKKISGEVFETRIVQAEKLIPAGRKKINGWLTLNESGEFDSRFLEEASPKTNDMVYLSAGVGAGVLKNQWVNDINFKIGLGFGSKGLQRNLYFAEFKIVYDFPGSDSETPFSINSFVSAGWEHNFSKNEDKEKWFGMSIGYLVDRNSDFFEKNTWKFAIHKRINQTISVNPELYFNGFFENIYPGVQIGISF